GLELQDGAVARDLPPPEIDAEVPAGQGLVLVSGRGATEKGADPGHELARAEGLGDIIVRAELEADDLVDLAGLRGEHKNGQVHLAAQVAADLKPVHCWGHEVQVHECRAFAARQGQRPFAVTRRADALPRSLTPVAAAR